MEHNKENLQANDKSFDTLYQKVLILKKENPEDKQAIEDIVSIMRMLVFGSLSILKHMDTKESNLEKEDSLKCLAMQIGQAKTEEDRINLQKQMDALINE